MFPGDIRWKMRLYAMNNGILRCLCIMTWFFCSLTLIIGCANTSESFPQYKSITMDNMVFGNSENERKAFELWQKIVKDDFTDVNAIMEMAKLLSGEDYQSQAVNLLEIAIKKTDPDNVDLLILMTSIIQKCPEKESSIAIQLLKKAVNLKPLDAKTHCLLGYAQNKDGLHLNAIAEFQFALELARDPDVVLSAQLGLATAYMQLENTKEAQIHIQLAREICPVIDDVIKTPTVPKPIYGGTDEIHESPEKRMLRILKKIKQQENRNE